MWPVYNMSVFRVGLSQTLSRSDSNRTLETKIQHPNIARLDCGLRFSRCTLPPFSPSLAFSQPVLIGSSENDHGYVFDEYEITVTNNSFYSIWYRGNGHGDVTTFWREQAPATPESTTAATHASPFSIVALHRGEKAKISTHIARDWGAFRVQFEVFDWRNRSAWCRSGSLRTADHPR